MLYVHALVQPQFVSVQLEQPVQAVQPEHAVQPVQSEQPLQAVQPVQPVQPVQFEQSPQSSLTAPLGVRPSEASLLACSRHQSSSP